MVSLSGRCGGIRICSGCFIRMRARAGMMGAEVSYGDGPMGEVRLDAGKAPRFGTAARSKGAFDALPDAQHAICRCSGRPRDRHLRRSGLPGTARLRSRANDA